jgi:hypothetical protein
MEQKLKAVGTETCNTQMGSGDMFRGDLVEVFGIDNELYEDSNSWVFQYKYRMVQYTSTCSTCLLCYFLCIRRSGVLTRSSHRGCFLDLLLVMCQAQVVT